MKRKLLTILATEIHKNLNRIKEKHEQIGIKQTWSNNRIEESFNALNGYFQKRKQQQLKMFFEID